MRSSKLFHSLLIIIILSSISIIFINTTRVSEIVGDVVQLRFNQNTLQKMHSTFHDDALTGYSVSPDQNSHSCGLPYDGADGNGKAKGDPNASCFYVTKFMSEPDPVKLSQMVVDLKIKQLNESTLKLAWQAAKKNNPIAAFLAKEAYEAAKKKREEQEEKIANLNDCEISEDEKDENTVFMYEIIYGWKSEISNEKPEVEIDYVDHQNSTEKETYYGDIVDDINDGGSVISDDLCNAANFTEENLLSNVFPCSSKGGLIELANPIPFLESPYRNGLDQGVQFFKVKDFSLPSIYKTTNYIGCTFNSDNSGIDCPFNVDSDSGHQSLSTSDYDKVDNGTEMTGQSQDDAYFYSGKEITASFGSFEFDVISLSQIDSDKDVITAAARINKFMFSQKHEFNAAEVYDQIKGMLEAVQNNGNMFSHSCGTRYFDGNYKEGENTGNSSNTDPTSKSMLETASFVTDFLVEITPVFMNHILGESLYSYLPNYFNSVSEFFGNFDNLDYINIYNQDGIQMAPSYSNQGELVQYLDEYSIERTPYNFSDDSNSAQKGINQSYSYEIKAPRENIMLTSPRPALTNVATINFVNNILNYDDISGIDTIMQQGISINQVENGMYSKLEEADLLSNGNLEAAEIEYICLRSGVVDRRVFGCSDPTHTDSLETSNGVELSIPPTIWKANIQVEELVYPEVKWGGETGSYNPRDEKNDPNNANYNYDSNYVNKFEGDIINYGLNLKALFNFPLIKGTLNIGPNPIYPVIKYDFELEVDMTYHFTKRRCEANGQPAGSYLELIVDEVMPEFGSINYEDIEAINWKSFSVSSDFEYAVLDHMTDMRGYPIHDDHLILDALKKSAEINMDNILNEFGDVDSIIKEGIINYFRDYMKIGTPLICAKYNSSNYGGNYGIIHIEDYICPQFIGDGDCSGEEEGSTEQEIPTDEYEIPTLNNDIDDFGTGGTNIDNNRNSNNDRRPTVNQTPRQLSEPRSPRRRSRSSQNQRGKRGKRQRAKSPMR